MLRKVRQTSSQSFVTHIETFVQDVHFKILATMVFNGEPRETIFGNFESVKYLCKWNFSSIMYNKDEQQKCSDNKLVYLEVNIHNWSLVWL